MRIFNEDILSIDGVSSAPQSLAANFTSQPLYLGHVYAYAIQLTFTGTPDGAFKLQGSSDPGNPSQPYQAVPAGTSQSSRVTHWTDLTGSAQSISAAGDLQWAVENPGYAWVRVVWTASGAGTSPVLATARINGKGA